MNRILYIQPYASHVGGVDSVLLELIEGLDKSLYKPYVVLPSPSPYVEKYQKLGAEVRFSPLAVFGKPTSWKYYFINMFNLVHSMFTLRKIVKHDQIHLIHSHKMEVMGANILGKLMGLPTIQTVHELPRRPLFAYKLIAYLDHLFNDYVIVLCEQSRSMFQWGGNKSKKVRKIYNGIKMSEHIYDESKLQLKRALGLDEQCKLVVTVARLAPMKGIEYLIEAAKLMKDQQPDIKFLVVGDIAFDADQAYKEHLHELVREKQLSETVYFLGLRRDIPFILSESDIFLLPSVFDIFPTVILEAMHMGLPIVATDVGGVPEMVHAEYGILVPPKEPAEIRNALLELLQRNYKEMGLRGKEIVETSFTREEYARKTMDLYEDALTGYSEVLT